IDDVAYVRFASVYRSFADIQTLKREVDQIVEQRRET
ncbi:MAG: transcriptional regulator NrdR, partial [Chloroflexi bacterium]|nr:transcriptional regulator NrdR [Chloroflexota bacterium]